MYALPPTRERRLIWLLALVQFTVMMDFMVMLPLGPQIMSAFRIAPSAFATAVSVYSWCSGLSSLLAATYIDRFDRRHLLIGTYALFALSNIGCALTPSYPWLLVARAFAGVTAGVLSASVMAIVADVVPTIRRGAATGVIMTSFSLAAIAGVPAGVMIGAHFGWSAPFWLLGTLSVLIGSVAVSVVPSLAEHRNHRQPSLAEALPALGRLFGRARHAKAFTLTFTMMVAQMLVIPFIAPMLVANHGITPDRLSSLYMAGGAATFFTSRAIGRLADRIGHRLVFRLFGVLTVGGVLLMTHLPQLPFVALLGFFACFMVMSSGRIVPMQAILTTVPEPRERGAFLSANGAVQAIGVGCGAWLGGLMIHNDAAGHLVGYGANGWLSATLAGLGLLWVGRVTSAPGSVEPKPASATIAATQADEAPALAPDA